MSGKTKNVAAASISRALYEAGIKRGLVGSWAGFWANGRPQSVIIVDWIEAPDSRSDTSAAGLAPCAEALRARGYHVEVTTIDGDPDEGPTVLKVSRPAA